MHAHAVWRLMQTLPLLLAEFSRRALDPLRTLRHTLFPWSRWVQMPRGLSRSRRLLRTLRCWGGRMLATGIAAPSCIC